MIDASIFKGKRFFFIVNNSYMMECKIWFKELLMTTLILKGTHIKPKKKKFAPITRMVVVTWKVVTLGQVSEAFEDFYMCFFQREAQWSLWPHAEEVMPRWAMIRFQSFISHFWGFYVFWSQWYSPFFHWSWEEYCKITFDKLIPESQVHWWRLEEM